MQTDKNIREGFIVDYISGQEIKATPEEVDAVQVFSKQLIEDYGYPRENIQTRPQFRVKVRPSDTKKEYPVDIAVFNNEKNKDDDAYIIIECKKKNRKDGRSQLEDYLDFQKAYLGSGLMEMRGFFSEKLKKEGQLILKRSQTSLNSCKKLRILESSEEKI